MKKFKRIYLEITNKCNLNCSFCVKKEEPRFISLNCFKKYVSEIKEYTDEVYLHILGEPLLHPNLDEFLDILTKNHLKINITTNGFLLGEKKNILKKYPINRLNISLNSAYFLDDEKLISYLDMVLDSISNLDATINLRLWAKNKAHDEFYHKVLNYLETKFAVKFDLNKEKNKIKDYLILNTLEEFEWPNIDSDYTSDGFCYGGKTHIGVLSSGKVVLCCLDAYGQTNLGSLEENSLKDIIATDKFQNSIKYFNNNKCYNALCKHCEYKNRFR